MKHLLYILLFCSCVLKAQEQKYILLDSITAYYKVKQYTLDTSPYGVKSTIEIYNVFSKFYGKEAGLDYIVLISVTPDFDNGTNWEEVNLEKFKNSLFNAKDLFKDIHNLVLDGSTRKIPSNINAWKVYPKLVKKEGNKYYAAKNTWIESFYCMEAPQEIVVSGGYVINTQQPILSAEKLKKLYEKNFSTNGLSPFELLGRCEMSVVPLYLEHIYLTNVEEKGKDTIYSFYQLTGHENRHIYRFAYIKNKGIVAGGYDDFFHRQRYYGKWGAKEYTPLKLNELLWAEELKKEWETKTDKQ